jgi:hypothetical protein
MALLMLIWRVGNAVAGVINRQNVTSFMELMIYFGNPRARTNPIKHHNAVVTGFTIPRLTKMIFHPFWP